MSHRILRSDSSPTKYKVHELDDFLSTKKTNLRKVKNAQLHNKESPLSRKKRKILNEIYETEKTYQHHLMLLTSLFIDPIKVSVVLPAKVIDGIFSNIEALQQVSSHLLELMEDEGVVHALLQLAPYMKLYSLYANNFDNANKVLEDWLKKSADFARLIRFQENREEMQNLKLTSLLITPIQRVPRYKLLLENLIEKTLEDDPDFLKLRGANDIIKDVATHINECVRQHENFHKMLAIQNSFVGAGSPKILVAGRLFVREGPVTKITNHGSAKERMFFLFNDILICAKKESYFTYQCCDILPLTHCIIEQVMGNSNGNGLFKILCDNKSLLVCAKGEKTPWVEDIKKTISAVHANLASFRRGDQVAKIMPSEDDVPIFKKTPVTFKIFSRASTTTTSSTTSSKESNLRQKNLPDVTMPSFKNRKDLIPKRLGSLINVNRQSMALLDAKRNSTSIDVSQPRMSTSSDMFHHMSSTHGESVLTNHMEDEVFRENRSNHHNWTITEKKSIQPRRPLHDITTKIACGSRKSRMDRRQSYSPYNLKDRKHKHSSTTNPSPDVVSEEETKYTVPEGVANTGQSSSTSNCIVM